MLLMLPDNVFELREFKLTAETQERLSMIYKVIQPFERDLDVVVMGHSDSMRFAKAKNEYLGNNFDLSSLRALRALQYMLAQGFPQEQISAQGAADGIRNSRTLSIKITWKEARLK
jgi:flagellar motor protein MotB